MCQLSSVNILSVGLNQSHTARYNKEAECINELPKNYTNQVVALDTERHGASAWHKYHYHVKRCAEKHIFLCFIEYYFHGAADCGREPG